jgi:hypothetical protein
MPCAKEIFLLATGPPALAYALRITRKQDMQLNDPAMLSDGTVPEGGGKFTIYLTCLTTHECKRFPTASLGNQYYCFTVRGLVWFRRYVHSTAHKVVAVFFSKSRTGGDVEVQLPS